MEGGPSVIVCDTCQENLATVHLTEIVEKTKKELHLCENCAQARGVSLGGVEINHPQCDAPASPSPSVPLSIKDLFGSIPADEAPEPASCPDCGVGLEQFRASGRLGCARDYDHFRAELEPLLKRIHNATRHVGRMPSSYEARLEEQERLSLYRRDLEAAVAREAYEEAARLRDAIRELEATT
jgi:protein arginine kinase activator